MVFNKNDYVSSTERIIISGTVNGFSSSRLADFLLTNKRIVLFDRTNQNPSCWLLKHISYISLFYDDREQSKKIHIRHNSENFIYVKNNDEWAETIFKEVSNAIAQL